MSYPVAHALTQPGLCTDAEGGHGAAQTLPKGSEGGDDDRDVLERFADLLLEERLEYFGLPSQEWRNDHHWPSAPSTRGTAVPVHSESGRALADGSRWKHEPLEPPSARVVVVNGERRVIGGDDDSTVLGGATCMELQTCGVPGVLPTVTSSPSTMFSNSRGWKKALGWGRRLASRVGETLNPQDDISDSSTTVRSPTALVHSSSAMDVGGCEVESSSHWRPTPDEESPDPQLWLPWCDAVEASRRELQALRAVKLCSSMDCDDEFPNVVALQAVVKEFLHLRGTCMKYMFFELNAFSQTVLPAVPVLLDLCDELDECAAVSARTRQRLRGVKGSVGAVARVLAMARRRRHLAFTQRVLHVLCRWHGAVHNVVGYLRDQRFCDAAEILHARLDMSAVELSASGQVTLDTVLSEARRKKMPLESGELASMLAAAPERGAGSGPVCEAPRDGEATQPGEVLAKAAETLAGQRALYTLHLLRTNGVPIMSAAIRAEMSQLLMDTVAAGGQLPPHAGARMVNLLNVLVTLGAVQDTQVVGFLMMAVESVVADRLLPQALLDASPPRRGEAAMVAAALSPGSQHHDPAADDPTTSSQNGDGHASGERGVAVGLRGKEVQLPPWRSIAKQLGPVEAHACMVVALSRLCALLRSVVHLAGYAGTQAADRDHAVHGTLVEVCAGVARQLPERALRVVLGTAAEMLAVIPPECSPLPDVLRAHRMWHRLTLVCAAVSETAAAAAQDQLLASCRTALEGPVGQQGIEALCRVFQSDLCGPLPVSASTDFPALFVLIPREETVDDVELRHYLNRPALNLSGEEGAGQPADAFVLNPFFSAAAEATFVDAVAADDTQPLAVFDDGDAAVLPLSAVMTVRRMFETARAATLFAAAAPSLIRLCLEYAATYMTFVVDNFVAANPAVPLEEEPAAPVGLHTAGLGGGGTSVVPPGGHPSNGGSSGARPAMGAASSSGASASSLIRVTLSCVPKAVRTHWDVVRRCVPTTARTPVAEAPCQMWRRSAQDKSLLFAAVERATMLVSTAAVTGSFKASLSALTPLLQCEQLPLLASASESLKVVSQFAQLRGFTHLAQQLLPSEALVTLMDRQYITCVAATAAASRTTTAVALTPPSGSGGSSFSFFSGRKSGQAGVVAMAEGSTPALFTPTDLSPPIQSHLHAFRVVCDELRQLFASVSSEDVAADPSLSPFEHPGLKKVLDHCSIGICYGFVEGAARLLRRLPQLGCGGGLGSLGGPGAGGASELQVLERFGLSVPTISSCVRQQMLYDAAALQKELMHIHPALNEDQIMRYLGGYANAAASEAIEDTFLLIKDRHQLYTTRQLLALAERGAVAWRRDVEHAVSKLTSHEDQLPVTIAF